MTTTPTSAPRPKRSFRLNVTYPTMYLILILGGIVSLLPFLWMFSLSFMSVGEMMLRHVLPSHIDFSNYIEAWTNANFSLYFRNSIIMSTVTVAGQLVFSTLAAYAFARMKFFGKSVFFTLVLSTLMIPESVTLIPNFLTVRALGWIDKLPALTVPFMASAFNIFLLRQFFAQIPDELYDAALIDGAGHFLFLRTIVLPLSKAALLTVTIFTFLGSWNALQWPLIVTYKNTWRPIAVGLYSFISEAGPELQLMMAGAAIALVPVLIIYFFVQKQFTEGIATSGLKG